MQELLFLLLFLLLLWLEYQYSNTLQYCSPLYYIESLCRLIIELDSELPQQYFCCNVVAAAARPSISGIVWHFSQGVVLFIGMCMQLQSICT